MRRIFLSMLLVASLAGFARAQDEMTGEVAEKAKKEIIELENQKVKILLSGKVATADWYERNSVSDVDLTSADGTTQTRAGVVAYIRSGPANAWGMLAVNHHDYHVRIYGVGSVPHTAIVSYPGDEIAERDGKRTRNYEVTTDVFVRLDVAPTAGRKLEEVWRRAVHHVTWTPPGRIPYDGPVPPVK